VPLFPVPVRTRVKWHGKALTASFGDASPAIVWRWTPDELPANFALRGENGQTHLLQNKPGSGESTIAIFASATAAERALYLLSKALLGPISIWRVIIGILAVIGLLLLSVCYFIYHTGTQMIHARQALGGGVPPAAAGPAKTAAAIPAARPSQAGPAAPVPGAPMDADQLYK
jgi:hypothetical protein